MNERRLTDLETKFSYQDAMIEELQRTVHAQYRTIEELEKKMKKITDQFKTAGKEVENPSHEKPPHY